MMGRNAFQVLGRGFAEPVEFVVCWTPKYSVDEAGRVCDASGGTGQAVRIAYALGIPVYHLSRPDDIVALRKIAKSSDVTP